MHVVWSFKSKSQEILKIEHEIWKEEGEIWVIGNCECIT